MNSIRDDFSWALISPMGVSAVTFKILDSRFKVQTTGTKHKKIFACALYRPKGGNTRVKFWTFSQLSKRGGGVMVGLTIDGPCFFREGVFQT